MLKRTLVVSFKRRLIERPESKKRLVDAEGRETRDAITLRVGVSFEDSLVVLLPTGTYERFDPEENAVYLDPKWSIEIAGEAVSFGRDSRDKSKECVTLFAHDVPAIRVEYKKERA